MAEVREEVPKSSVLGNRPQPAGNLLSAERQGGVSQLFDHRSTRGQSGERHGSLLVDAWPGTQQKLSLNEGGELFDHFAPYAVHRA